MSECKAAVDTNQLLNAEEKRQDHIWIRNVVFDANSKPPEKRRTLANYRLSGQKSRDLPDAPQPRST